jgi:hypothetical protein
LKDKRINGFGWWLALFSATLVNTAAPAWAQSGDKAEINIINNRSEAVVMRFDYAFRDFTWNLIEHAIAPRDEITYRFPSNIPGCEYIRDWHITDGLLTISTTNGPICEKRVSLCDKITTVMNVGLSECRWTPIE